MNKLLTISILGTSNSIMKGGYTYALADHPEIVIQQNLSIGSSHPPLVPYRLVDQSLAGSDILLIDVGINEQRMLVKRGYSEHAFQTSSDVLDYVLSACTETGTIPVILLMPERFGHKTPGQRQRIRKHYIEQCKRRSMPYYDGYAFAEELAKQSGTPYSRLFEDDAHIQRHHAYALGQDLAASLLRWHSQVQRSFETRSYALLSCLMPPHDNERSVTRSTSIAQAAFIRLQVEDHIDLQAPPNSEVVGLSFNMARSNCSLVIEGASATTKSLATSFYSKDRALWMVIWSLMTPIRIGEDGNLRLKAVERNSDEDVELHDHGPLLEPYRADSQQVEIAGLVLRNTVRKCSMLRIANPTFVGPLASRVAPIQKQDGGT